MNNPFLKKTSTPINPFEKAHTSTSSMVNKPLKLPSIVKPITQDTVTEKIVEKLVETVTNEVTSTDTENTITEVKIEENVENTVKTAKNDSETVTMTETVSNETNDETTTENVEVKSEDESVTAVENIEPAKKRKRRKSNTTETVSSDTAEVKDNISKYVTEITVEPNDYSDVHNSIPFAEAIERFGSCATDEEWNKYKDEIIKQNNKIVINNDINSGVVITLICQLSNLRDMIWSQYQYYKTQYEALSSKEPEGLIERTKKINIPDSATNDTLRKKAGIISCITYKDSDGNNINLFELLDEVRARYNFLRAIVENIEFKKNLLITLSSALKIEQSLTKNVD